MRREKEDRYKATTYLRKPDKKAMTTDYLQLAAEAETLAEKATRGPWYAEFDHTDGYQVSTRVLEICPGCPVCLCRKCGGAVGASLIEVESGSPVFSCISCGYQPPEANEKPQPED